MNYLPKSGCGSAYFRRRSRRVKERTQRQIQYKQQTRSSPGLDRKAEEVEEYIHDYNNERIPLKNEKE